MASPKRLFRFAVNVAFLVACLWAQDLSTFEVASVKASAPGGPGFVIRQMPGGQTYRGTNVSLRVMMTVAYSLRDTQITGGPGWVDTDRFDLEAKAAKPSTSDELHIMLQHLLEERFQIKLRRETREMPVLVLTVDKSGAKMPLHSADDINYPPISRTGPETIVGQNIKMDYFALYLARVLDRNVLDRTNLSGRYDVSLRAAQFVRPSDGMDPDNLDGPTIFTALREQLGLKLERARGPVEFLVIEKVAKPEN